jgi:hypothetical protein
MCHIPRPIWTINRVLGSRRSAARSAWQVPLLCARILVVSSKPLQIEQREFGGRFICVYWALYNVPCVTSVAKKKSGPHHAHGNGHGHMRVYARLRHIKRQKASCTCTCTVRTRLLVVLAGLVCARWLGCSVVPQVILVVVVSSRPLWNTQREFGERSICA